MNSLLTLQLPIGYEYWIHCESLLRVGLLPLSLTAIGNDLIRFEVFVSLLLVWKYLIKRIC